MKTQRGTLRTILVLAWPTVLEQTMQVATQYVDSAMVGWLGAAATAAIGTTTTINWLVNTSVSALEIGFLAYIAREYGANSCCPSQPLHPEEYLRPSRWLLSNLRHISPEARRMP